MPSSSIRVFADGKERFARDVYAEGEKLSPPLNDTVLKRAHKILGWSVQQKAKGWVWSVTQTTGESVTQEGMADDCSDRW